MAWNEYMGRAESRRLEKDSHLDECNSRVYTINYQHDFGGLLERKCIGSKMLSPELYVAMR